MTLSLRERTRGAVRDEVMRCAWILFAEQGYAATTVEQVAEAAGMSRRTFFRYFANKDDLVLQRMLESSQQLADELAARPADEPAWQALRAAFDPVLEVQRGKRDFVLRLLGMIHGEIELSAALQTRDRRWRALLTPLVAERLPASADPAVTQARAGAVAASALACLHASQLAWLDHPDADPGTLLDAAMGAVAPLG